MSEQGPIDPTILHSLGLAPSDQAFSPEIQRQQKLRNVICSWGRDFYSLARRSKGARRPGHTAIFDCYAWQRQGLDLSLLKGIHITTAFPLGDNPSELPDKISEGLKKHTINDLWYKSAPRDINYWIVPDDFEQKPEVQLVLQRLEIALSSFLKGFAEAALSEGDWQAAINAFDLTEKEGVLKNGTIMETLRGYAQADKAAGIEIARAIQSRENRRKQLS